MMKSADSLGLFALLLMRIVQRLGLCRNPMMKSADLVSLSALLLMRIVQHLGLCAHS